MIVTRLPKRRNICANSTPMKPSANDHQVLGQVVEFHNAFIVQKGTSSRPSIRGTKFRVPVSRKIWDACSRRTSTVQESNLELARTGKGGLSADQLDMRILQPLLMPPRKFFTIERLRSRTRSISTAIRPSLTP